MMEMHSRRIRIRIRMMILDRSKIRKRNRMSVIKIMRSWLYNTRTVSFIVDKDFNQLLVMDMES